MLRTSFLWAMFVRGVTAAAVVLVLMEVFALATGFSSFGLASVVVFGSILGAVLHALLVLAVVGLAAWPTRARYRRYREKGVLSVDPNEFHILVSLLDGERHGFGITRDVLQRTEGEVWLGPGSLYVVIERLRQRGLVADCGRRPAPDLGDEPRRYFRLTPQGRAFAEREVDRARDKGLVGVS